MMGYFSVDRHRRPVRRRHRRVRHRHRRCFASRRRYFCSPHYWSGWTARDRCTSGFGCRYCRRCQTRRCACRSAKVGWTRCSNGWRCRCC